MSAYRYLQIIETTLLNIIVLPTELRLGAGRCIPDTNVESTDTLCVLKTMAAKAKSKIEKRKYFFLIVILFVVCLLAIYLWFKISEYLTVIHIIIYFTQQIW